MRNLNFSSFALFGKKSRFECVLNIKNAIKTFELNLRHLILGRIHTGEIFT